MDAGQFELLMRSCGFFEPQPHIVVGCSGGADSLALTIMLDQWCRNRDGHVIAVTIDHGLRPESADEAEYVQAQLQALGIDCIIRRWHHDGVSSAMQEQARRARRTLLTEETIRLSALHLALGHHRDDQVETLAMRAERDSFWTGWSGMAHMRSAGHVQILRPFLSVPKENLRDICRSHHIQWIDDPGNYSDRFRRGYIRNRNTDWPIDAINALSTEATTYRNGWQRALSLWAVQAASVDIMGCWHINPERSDHIPVGAADWLGALLATVSGADYAIGARRIQPHEAQIDAIMAGNGPKMTLAGCVLRPARRQARGGMLVYREYAACAETVLAATNMPALWDGRFLLAVSTPEPGMVWRALGPEGVARIRQQGWYDGESPAELLWTQPALWQGDTLWAAPTLSVQGQQAAEKNIFCQYAPMRALTAND